MTQQVINIGSAPNDSTGDPIRTAFDKINTNFTELYTTGAGSSNFRLQLNTMSTSVGNINLSPAGGGSIVTGSLNNLFVSNTAVSTDQNTGALVVAGGVGIGGNVNAGSVIANQFIGYHTGAIGANVANTGRFTNVDSTLSNATIFNAGNVISTALYVSTQANFYSLVSTASNLGNAYAANLSVGNTFTANNASISNAYIFGGSISGVSISITGVDNTPIGATTPNTAVFTKMTTANAQITGGSISGVSITPSAVNGAPIGNATPSTGQFTALGASGVVYTNSATTSTSTSTGSIIIAGGAGIAGNINAGGNVTAAVVAATSNGLGTNFKVGDDAWVGDININNTARLMGQQDNTQGYIVFGNGDTASLGRSGTGALTYAGNFNAAAITGSTVSAGTIGNSGALLTGTITTNAQPYITSVGILTGLIVNGTLGATTLNGAFGGPFNGTIGASVPNAAAFTSITACNNVTIYGTLTASQFNIVGNVTGNLSGTASSATTAGTATYASTAGLASAATTVVQAYQGNITGLGYLGNITVLTNASVGNLYSSGVVTSTGNITTPDTLLASNVNAANMKIIEGNLTIANTFSIGNSFGRLGDVRGKIVWDSGNIYVCTADYNGASAIWKRANLLSF